MNLIFEQTANRHQCGCEVLVNDFLMQCTFSSSKTVTIPAGLQFSNGKLEQNTNETTTTLAVCANHEKRLRNAFDEFTKNTAL